MLSTSGINVFTLESVFILANSVLMSSKAFLCPVFSGLDLESKILKSSLTAVGA